MDDWNKGFDDPKVQAVEGLWRDERREDGRMRWDNATRQRVSVVVVIFVSRRSQCQWKRVECGSDGIDCSVVAVDGHGMLRNEGRENV